MRFENRFSSRGKDTQNSNEQHWDHERSRSISLSSFGGEGRGEEAFGMVHGKAPYPFAPPGSHDVGPPYVGCYRTIPIPSGFSQVIRHLRTFVTILAVSWSA